MSYIPVNSLLLLNLSILIFSVFTCNFQENVKTKLHYDHLQIILQLCLRCWQPKYPSQSSFSSCSSFTRFGPGSPEHFHWGSESPREENGCPFGCPFAPRGELSAALCPQTSLLRRGHLCGRAQPPAAGQSQGGSSSIMNCLLENSRTILRAWIFFPQVSL